MKTYSSRKYPFWHGENSWKSQQNLDETLGITVRTPITVRPTWRVHAPSVQRPSVRRFIRLWYKPRRGHIEITRLFNKDYVQQYGFNGTRRVSKRPFPFPFRPPPGRIYESPRKPRRRRSFTNRNYGTWNANARTINQHRRNITGGRPTFPKLFERFSRSRTPVQLIPSSPRSINNNDLHKRP